jgi:hypothetical protein
MNSTNYATPHYTIVYSVLLNLGVHHSQLSAVYKSRSLEIFKLIMLPTMHCGGIHINAANATVCERQTDRSLWQQKCGWNRIPLHLIVPWLDLQVGYSQPYSITNDYQTVTATEHCSNWDTPTDTPRYQSDNDVNIRLSYNSLLTVKVMCYHRICCDNQEN